MSTDQWKYYYLYEGQPEAEISSYINRHLYNAGGLGRLWARKVMELENLGRRFSPERRTVLVFDGRYKEIPVAVSENYNVIMLQLGSSSVNKEAKVNNIKRYDMASVAVALNEAFLEKDKEKLSRTVEKVRSFLKDNHVDICVLPDFWRIIYRILINVCIEENIPVVWYEHGIVETFIGNDKEKNFQKGVGKLIDYRWTWSQKNKEAIIENEVMAPEKVMVAGPQYQVTPKTGRSLNRSLLFVGGSEILNNTDEALAKKYYDVVKAFYDCCTARNISFVYKKHPKESDDAIIRYLGQGVRLDNRNLSLQFEENELVAGVRTTALIEAGLNGNIVVQCILDETKSKWNQYENAYKISSSQELEEFFDDYNSGKISAKTIEDYQLYYKENLSIRVSAAIEEVLNRKRENGNS